MYHLVFVVLFGAMAAGILTRRGWGLRVVMAGIGIYSVDKILSMADSAGRAAWIEHTLGSIEVVELLGTGILDSASVGMGGVTLACWWGFLLYLRFQRKHFETAAQ